MIKLGDFWFVGKADGMFEYDFYSPIESLVYAVKSVSSELTRDYFSWWNRLKRKSFACVRMTQQQKNPVAVEIECVGVQRENYRRKEGINRGLLKKMLLREHYGDKTAEMSEYDVMMYLHKRLWG